MNYEKYVSIVANWSAILTAFIAVLGYGRYVISQWDQRRALENYLREEKRMGHDEGRRSIIHLMGNLSMSEAELLSAAFRSDKVRSRVRSDGDGRADGLLFEYLGADLPAPQRF